MAKVVHSQEFKIHKIPEMKDATLVVGLAENAAGLGSVTVGYLNTKLGGWEFAEINPERFFQLGGVSVDKDVAQFPESKFYCCQEKNLVLFASSAPQTEWYVFLNTILDVIEKCCSIKEIFTIGGMVSIAAHTSPREIVATANSVPMKTILHGLGLKGGMNYETPPGQRPTLSSYLIWVAQGRGINGACIWIPVPFYLAAITDIQAEKKAIDFLNDRLTLGLNLTEINEDLIRQNQRIEQVLQKYPELNVLINRLESGLGLTEEESNMLTEIMVNQLSGHSLK